MKPSRIAVAMLAALSALALPLGSPAYTLRESNGGAPVRWHVSERPVRVDASIGHLGPASRARAAVLDALAAWSSVEGNPLAFEPEGGFRHDLGTGERLDGITDVSMVDEDWELDPSFLAITLVTYDPASGEIWDADVVLNGDDHSFGAGEPGPGHFDLASVLTHEVGHLVGLGHSELAEATMYTSTLPGDTAKRSLALDDELGMQALYHGQPMDGGAGCSLVHTPANRGTSLLWIGLGLGAWLRRRRPLKASAR